MSDILISIIVPVYNSEKYIDKCIKSVLTQNFKNFELILVNDGSTDKSYSICKLYSKIDNRVKVIDSINEGVSSARNKGLANSKGKYVIFIDSDDFIDENFCLYLYKYISIKNESLVICGFTKDDKKNDKKNDNIFNENEELTVIEKKDFFEIYLKWLLNFPWNKIYNRQIIMKNKIKFDENIKLGEDLLFNLNYLKFTDDKIYIINKSLYNYVIENNDSLTNKYYENFFIIQKNLYTEIKKYFSIFNSDFRKYEKKFYSEYLISIIWSLNNTFNKKNKMSFYKKLKLNSKILRSFEIKECLAKINKKDFSRLNILLIKTKSPLFQNMYEKIRKTFKK